MKLLVFACRHEVNCLALKNQPFGGRAEEILGTEAFAEAKREITSWPGYAPTPLVPLADYREPPRCFRNRLLKPHRPGPQPRCLRRRTCKDGAFMPVDGL